MEGDRESELSDSNSLGEESLGTFWSEKGLTILERIITDYPEQLAQVTIITDTGKKLQITEFLDVLRTLKIRY